MRFNVVEKLCIGKWADERCEDVLHESEGFVAVIDGATSISPAKGAAKTSGRIMAELIDEGLHTIPRGADLRQTLRGVNELIRDRLGYTDSDAVLASGNRPCAAAIILSRDRNEVWSVGDGWLMADKVTKKFEISFADPYTYLRCAYLSQQLRKGVLLEELLASKKDAELIAPFIALQPDIQNDKRAGRFAYGVIDGADQCVDFAIVTDVRDANEVVLASDGFPAIRSTLAESEAILEDAIKRDPLMIDLFPQAKPVRPGQVSFDDRTYVRLKRT